MGRKRKRKAGEDVVPEIMEIMRKNTERAGKGGGVTGVASAPSDDLFFVDTAPAKTLTRAERKRAARAKVLAVDKAIAGGNALAMGAATLLGEGVVDAKKRRKAEKAAAERAAVAAKRAREAAKVAERKMKIRVRRLQASGKMRDVKEVLAEEETRKIRMRKIVAPKVEGVEGKIYDLKDVWAEEDARTAFVAENPEEHVYVVDVIHPRKRKRKLLPDAKKRIANVFVPGAGASYNPAREDHVKHLKKASRREFNRQKRERKINKLLPPGAKKRLTTNTLLDVLVPVEMMDDLDAMEEEDGEESDSDFDADGERLTKKEKAQRRAAMKIRKTPIPRKTRAQRNKIKRKIAEGQRQMKRVYEINLREAAMKAPMVLKRLEKNAAKRAVKKAAAAAARPKGPQPKVPLLEPEFLLPEELPSSLRQLEAQGSLISDRTNAIFARGAIEVPKFGAGPNPRKWVQYRNRIDKREEWNANPINDDAFLVDSSSGDESSGDDGIVENNHGASRVPGSKFQSMQSVSRAKRKNRHNNNRRNKPKLNKKGRKRR